jgi:hypothetical protein
MLSIFLGLSLSPVMQAAEEGAFFGAHMLQPRIEATPAADGLLDLTCTVPLIGGCCFPLTSHKVTATLTAPAGVTVVSGPEPASYDAIEAPVSGTPKAFTTFRWCVKHENPDAQATLTIVVNSADSGQVKATYALGRQAACRVSGPQLPESLPLGEALPLAVDASCLDDNHFVQMVRFWYSAEIPADAEAVEMPEGLAAQGIFRFTESGRRLMVQGQSMDLARKYEPTIWYGTLPAQTKGPLYGAAVAVDDTGRAACGPVVRSVAPAQAAASEVRPAAGAPESFARGSAWWILAGITVSAACVGCAMLVTRRRRPAIAAFGAAMIGVASLVVLDQMRATPASPHETSLGYPADSSVVVYLFLDRGDASRQLAQQIETYRTAAPHRIHVLSFVEGTTPQTILNAQRERFQVKQIPAVVLDARTLIDGANTMAVPGTLDRCLAKPPARLSMEMHGGVIAGRELSLGFLMCNHGVDHEVKGSTTMFACESGVPMGEWSCDRVVRGEVAEGRPYAIPSGKCQAPLMLKWSIPAGMNPAHVGALTLVFDEQGSPIDSICTEKPCTRFGTCG